MAPDRRSLVGVGAFLGYRGPTSSDSAYKFK
jgi:hypothetical protein